MSEPLPGYEPMRRSIFLVDDHELVRRAMRLALEDVDGFEVVGEAASALTAIEAIERLRPDIALVDVHLGDGSGLDVCAAVRGLTHCLVLSGTGDDDDIRAAVRAGAAGFLLKSIRVAAIVGAVTQVCSGTAPVFVAPYASAPVADTKGPLMARLTNQERSTLQCLVDGKSNAQIAAEMHLAIKTVKNYVSNVLMKLEVTTRTEAAVYAVRGRAGV